MEEERTKELGANKESITRNIYIYIFLMGDLIK